MRLVGAGRELLQSSFSDAQIGYHTRPVRVFAHGQRIWSGNYATNCGLDNKLRGKGSGRDNRPKNYTNPPGSAEIEGDT
jgi:hypothetical protein